MPAQDAALARLLSALDGDLGAQLPATVVAMVPAGHNRRRQLYRPPLKHREDGKLFSKYLRQLLIFFFKPRVLFISQALW